MGLQKCPRVRKQFETSSAQTCSCLSASHHHALSLHQYPESFGDEEATGMQAIQMVLGERLPRAEVRTTECVAGCEAGKRVKEIVPTKVTLLRWRQPQRGGSDDCQTNTCKYEAQGRNLIRCAICMCVMHNKHVIQTKI